MKTKFRTFTHWLDNNILLILTGFLLVFIPLYPKIPLAELIPGYIVRMRLEDVFVLFTALIWLIQVIRQKVKYRSIILWLIVLYLIISFLSLVSALFITPAIPVQPLHMGKSFLHWVRYLEYFTLFAISFSAVKSTKDAKLLVKIMILTLIGVIVYGYGQKYHYWPVFSTMNREFSKGIRLYLTKHARVQSTFGGHYDLAGYLVILLPIALSWAMTAKKKAVKLGLHLLHLIGLWLLILTASRVSFAAYYAAIIFSLTVLASSKFNNQSLPINAKKTASLKRKKTLKQFGWWLIQSGLYSLLIILMMLGFGQDMRDRLLHVTKDYPQIEESYEKIEQFVEDAPKTVVGFFKIEREERKPGDDWVAVNLEDQEPEQPVEEIDPVLDKTDERPTTQRPADVYEDIPDRVRVATESATGEKSFVMIERERTWSENAMKYGLSMAIRLDTLWPNAINSFKRNPLLGTGFATLNKEAFFHFTEAESTDNNFLRSLGETGLLGFVSFYFIILVNITLALKLAASQTSPKSNSHKKHQAFILALGAGYVGASVGLLVNALYIDVYASSKIAFTYWAITGILVSLCYQDQYWPFIQQSWPIKLQQKVFLTLSKLGIKNKELS